MNHYNEKEIEGVVVRQSNEHPKLWAAADGRIAGVRGKWLKLQCTNSQGHYGVHYVQDKVYVNVRVHRLVAEVWVENPDGLPVVDHRDGVVTNNTSANLKWSTQRSNQHNLKGNREGTFSSTYIGVSLVAGKYRATIWNGKAQHLGTFALELDAAKAYDDASDEIGHGRPNKTTK